MKKLALVMVFVLLTALFIAFNYLLWDREGREKAMSDLQNANASNNASISAQNREIKSLEDENTKLQETIENMENDQRLLQENMDRLTSDKNKSELALTDKVQTLNALKLLADAKFLQEPVKAWAEALDAGKYDKAYELEYGSMDTLKRPITLSEYTDILKKTLKRISLKSVEIDPGKGNDSGEIYLAATLDVSLADNADKSLSRFSEGQNIRYVKLVYNPASKAFEIAGISS